MEHLQWRPWGWGDNRLASGIRGAAVKDLPFLQRHRGPQEDRQLSVLRCRSCAWGHACLLPGGIPAGSNHLPPEQSSGGGKPSAPRRPWVTGAQPPEPPGGWPGRTLLCRFDFPALECFQCYRVNASGVCESRGGTCQTKENQQCFLRKISEGRWCLTGLRGELCWRLGVDSGCPSGTLGAGAT